MNPDDQTTISTIKACTKTPYVLVPQEQEHPGVRSWGQQGRYEDMVLLRNRLLQEVRDINPDLFLSLDSDILLHPDALDSLLDGILSYSAVGGKVYMNAKFDRDPSYAMITTQNNLHRPDAFGLMRVDVIMALKLMTRLAYNVDYVFSDQGEDIGWSKEVRKRGLSLGWDGRVCSKHVMMTEMLDEFDPRCGF